MTMETLERVYGHHAPDHHESVTEAFDRSGGRMGAGWARQNANEVDETTPL
jgi:hypothetical protein